MYESFYKLSAKPFALNPDPHFFYGGRSHKQAMSYLRYGMGQGEGIVVITGDLGTGKTLLARTLLAGQAKEDTISAHLVISRLDADELLHMVAEAFGLEHEGLDKAALIRNIENFFVRMAKQRKRLLLVVDNAQSLPHRSLEELRMLSNYEMDGKILLQTFLIGRSEFRDTLQSAGMEQLRQRVIAAYHLNPFASDEIQGYIEHRLRLVGWQGSPRITEAGYAAIHDITGGIPRRINQLCERLLLYGYLEELGEFGDEEVRKTDREIKDETSLITPTEDDASSHARNSRGDAMRPDVEGFADNVIALDSSRTAGDDPRGAMKRGMPPADMPATGGGNPAATPRKEAPSSIDGAGIESNGFISGRLQAMEEMLRSLEASASRRMGDEQTELHRRIDDLQEQINMLAARLRPGRHTGE